MTCKQVMEMLGCTFTQARKIQKGERVDGLPAGPFRSFMIDGLPANHPANLGSTLQGLIFKPTCGRGCKGENMFSENDIVQIVDKTDPWFPSLLIVTEPKSWGVMAYCHIPQSNIENKTSQAYRRIKNESLAKVGRAEVIAVKNENAK